MEYGPHRNTIKLALLKSKFTIHKDIDSEVRPLLSGTGNHQVIQWRSQQEWKEAACQNSHSNVMSTHLARKHLQSCYVILCNTWSPYQLFQVVPNVCWPVRTVFWSARWHLCDKWTDTPCFGIVAGVCCDIWRYSVLFQQHRQQLRQAAC